MRNVIMFGPPGSGKGTQSANIVRRYGLSHLSTGVMLRNEIAAGTALGQEVDAIISKGELAPDEIVSSLAMRFASHHQGEKGIVFDGFPRTTVQAERLDKLLEERGLCVDLVIFIDISEQEIFNRILGRSADSHRSDDKIDIIARRIKIYRDMTFPVIRYYHVQGKFECVNGMAEVGEVFQRICNVISRRLPELEAVEVR